MKLVKSLLLGTTAIVAAAGAQAADLPVRQAAVVQNVCANLGSSFAGAWVMPGTDTCVQLSGFIRGEYIIRERAVEYQDLASFRAYGRLQFDVRHASDIGLVRGVVRLDGFSSPYLSGPFGLLGAGLSTTAAGIGAPGVGAQGLIGGASVASVVVLDAGFVEIQNATGQFIAGRSTNNFNPGPGGDRYTGARLRDGTRNEQFAYTFGLGQGLTFTAAVETPVRINSFGFLPGSGVGVGTFANQGATFGFDPVTGIVAPGGAFVTGLVYGGQEAPDFIGRLQANGTWGQAWISGAVHQVTDVGLLPVPGAAGFVGRAPAEDEIGFAVEGVAQVNLPFLPGSLAWVLAGYTQGALGYMGFFNTGETFGGRGLASAASGTPALRGLPTTDAVVVGNELQLTEAWHVGGQVRFQLAPTWRANIYGTYTEVDFADAANRTIPAGTAPVGGVNVVGAQAGFVDFSEGIIAGNIIWTPARNLDLGVEVLYARASFDSNIVISEPTLTGTGFTTRVDDNVDEVIARFRVNRAF